MDTTQTPLNLQVPSQSPYPSPIISPATNHVNDVKPEVKVEPGTEAPPPPSAMESSTMQAILAFLKKNNLKGTEEALKSELMKVASKGVASVTQPDINEVGNVLAAYKSEGDPSSYEAAYRLVQLLLFCSSSCSCY